MNKLPLTHTNIIQLLGIESLPLEKRKEIVSVATDLVETRTFNRVISQLNNEQKEQFANLLEKEDMRAVGEFFGEYNIDIMSITEKEVEKVKQELLEISKE